MSEEDKRRGERGSGGEERRGRKRRGSERRGKEMKGKEREGEERRARGKEVSARVWGSGEFMFIGIQALDETMKSRHERQHISELHTLNKGQESNEKSVYLISL